MGLFKRFSFLLLSVLLVAAGVTYTVLTGELNAGALGILLVVTCLSIWFVLARRGVRTPADPEKRLRRARSTGRPVAVYFYSDFSLACLLMRPFTARAEREHKGHFDFLYLEAGHPDVQALAGTLGARLNQWLIYDSAGRLAIQTTRITPQEMASVLTKAHKS